MALSKRNPLPMALVIIAVAVFFYFGISTGEDGKRNALYRDTASDQVTTGGTGADQEPDENTGEIENSTPLLAADTTPSDISTPLSQETIDAEAHKAVLTLEQDLPVESSPRNGDDVGTGRQVNTTDQLSAQDQRLDLSGASALKEGASELKAYQGLYDLTFDDIKFDLPPEEPFAEEQLTDEVRAIDGQRVKIRGYIKPSFSQRGLKSFVFVRDNKECCFGPNAAIYDCMLVKLKKQTTTEYTVRPVTVEGTFYLKAYQGPDGNVWAIYRMKDASVK